MRISDRDFEHLRDYIRNEFGIDLTKKKVLVECRMSCELEKRGIPSIGAFMEQMEQNKGGELQMALLNRLTTNYTYFMREPKHFEYLEKSILPEIKKEGSGSFKIWCAGCSSGEECYTLAMLLRNYNDFGGGLPDFEILGTDISEKALEQAKKAVYSNQELAQIPVLWQKKYCRPSEVKNHFEIQGELQKYVRFMRMNLLKPNITFGQYDLILCRNVMIYFDEAARKKLLDNLYRALKPGGYLFVGHTELLPRNHECFKYICPAIYRK